MKHFEFTVTDEYAGERIDKCISELYEDFSRSYIQKLIKDNLVNVSPNKENCELSKSVKGSYILKEGNFVFFDTKESIIPDIVPEDIPLDILYEDSDVLVVNKPKGMVVHPAPGHYSNTLVNAVMFHVKDLSGINGVLRPGIVHRIDMNTTGSLIICKNDKAHIDIAGQLKEHSINRLYRAIVHGVIKEDEGTVNKPIGRNEKDRKKMACNVTNAKNAVTHYKVLKRFKDYTYIECKLETGRTHQIRAHMSSIGCPILGDNKYGNKKLNQKYSLSKQCLYSYKLAFDFTTDSGILSYLDKKEFSTNDIWFMDYLK